VPIQRSPEVVKFVLENTLRRQKDTTTTATTAARGLELVIPSSFISFPDTNHRFDFDVVFSVHHRLRQAVRHTAFFAHALFAQ
jgi:hypothetical protein